MTALRARREEVPETTGAVDRRRGDGYGEGWGSGRTVMVFRGNVGGG